MRRSLLFFFCFIAAARISAIHVVIIESQTSAAWATQDVNWHANALALGYTAEIVPQSTLDNLSNLSSADILLVSSGIFTFLSEDHLTTVIDFVMGGRSAYIQSEYLGTYQGNITFQAVMTAANADFTWTGTVSGQLVPMNILGDMATTPNVVTTLDYFNYGYAGHGEGVEPFLEFQGEFFGFCYIDPLSTYGTVITVSDEDWAWSNSSPELMQNILYKLVQGTSFIPSSPQLSQIDVYPNPFVNETMISFSNSTSGADIVLMNSMGEVVRSISNVVGGRYILQREGLASGTYFVRILSGEMNVETKKLIIN